MSSIEAVSTKEKKWTELIRQQRESKLSVSAFCRDRGFSGQTFHNWRKRLGNNEPVLVEAEAAGGKEHAPVELLLASGERLRISPGADASTLRTVLSVLRERT